LIADSCLVGVLTLYSSNAGAFTEDHRRIIEAVARQISQVVHASAEFDRGHSVLKDALTGLPNLERLRGLTLADVGLSTETCSDPLSLLFIDVDGLKNVNARAGREIGDAVVAHAAKTIRRVLRGGDILFRYGGDEFVVLLSKTDAETAQIIGDRVRSMVGTSPLDLTDGSSLRIFVTIGIATHPADGLSLADLISAAKQRILPDGPSSVDLAPGIH
jgi:diguanylate cyclase (GGDEF)-like protein